MNTPPDSKRQVGLIMAIKEFIAKIFIYFTGIRFYEQAAVDSKHGETLVGQSIVRTVMHTSVTFNFYRKTYRDLIFKRGSIRTEVFIGYSIECQFDDSFSEYMRRYNNLKFVVRQKSLKVLPEKAMMYILMNFYVNFISAELHKNEAFMRASKL